MAIPEEEYSEAFMTAGKHLQARMDEAAVGGFRWIKAQPSRPAFADLVFAIGQKIYAVLLVSMTSQKQAEAGAHASFEIPKEQHELLLSECERYRLEPVAFPLWLGIMQPLTTGWNLFSLKDMSPLNPAAVTADERPEPMSEWELNNFRIMQVMKDIDEHKLAPHSYQDIPGIFPNIWFDDPEGARAWVAVLSAEAGIPQAVKDLRHKLPQDIRGYIARVEVSSAERPGDIPMRNTMLRASYKGLERLP